MKSYWLEILRCPSCGASPPTGDVFASNGDQIETGVLICPVCRAWYPIEAGVLELLPQTLQYREERARFWNAHRRRMEQSNLTLTNQPLADGDPRELQQRHFDHYSANQEQNYDEYERMPFGEPSIRLFSRNGGRSCDRAFVFWT